MFKLNRLWIKKIRRLLLVLMLFSLTGCFSWIRAYQTYLQMKAFDTHFSIRSDEEFSLYFKDPILYGHDFIALSKLQASEKQPDKWRYWFRKVDEQGQIVQPEVKFYFDLHFNEEQLLTRWSFSSLFLEIAPPAFIEVSLRSLGQAKINQGKKQLKTNTDLIKKIETELPKKAQVIDQLGQPLSIEDLEKKWIYHYQFQLESSDIEAGYEDRRLSQVKLIFDKQHEELIKMSGRFVGLKVSINYQKLVQKKAK